LKYYENAVSSFDPRKKPKPEVLEEGFIKILEYAERIHPPSAAESKKNHRVF
jgi:hypothetical protein